MTNPDDHTVAEVIRVFETPTEASAWVDDQGSGGGIVTYEAHGELAVEAIEENGVAVDRTAEVGGWLLGADHEAGEAGDADVLARLRGDLGAHLLDRLAVVLVDVDVLLLKQDDVLGPLA